MRGPKDRYIINLMFSPFINSHVQFPAICVIASLFPHSYEMQLKYQVSSQRQLDIVDTLDPLFHFVKISMANVPSSNSKRLKPLKISVPIPINDHASRFANQSYPIRSSNLSSRYVDK